MLLDIGAERIDRVADRPLPTAPRGFGESFGIELDAFRATEQFFSEERAYYDAYEDAAERLYRATGKRVVNPMALPKDEPVPAVGLLRTTIPSRQQALNELNAALADARGQHPDLPDPTQIDAKIIADAKAAADLAQRVAPVSSGTGRFAGMMWGALTDEVNLMTLPLGATARITGGTAARILKTALIEGSIGAGTEAAIAIGTADFRERVGVQSNPAANIAAGFAGGAILGGGIRGLVEGWRALRGPVATLAERDAVVVLDRQMMDAEANPRGPAFVEQHSAELDAAIEAVARGRLYEGPYIEPGTEIGRQPDLSFTRGESAFVPYEKEPRRLTQFLRELGGLKDVGGDVRHTLGGARFRPGLINNRSGIDLDDATQRAWDAGYINATERPSIDELKAAIEQDLKGQPRYSSRDSEAVEQFQRASAINAETDRMANEWGVSPKDKTPEQFWDAVADRMSMERAFREVKDMSDAIEADFAKADAEAKAFVESRGDAWVPDEFHDSVTGRTLEDLEREYREAQSANPMEYGESRGQQPGPSAGSAGDVPGSTGQGRGGAGVAGRGGPSTGSATDPILTRRAAAVQSARETAPALEQPEVIEATVQEARRVAAAEDIAIAMDDGTTKSARLLLEEAEDRKRVAKEIADACAFGRASE